MKEILINCNEIYKNESCCHNDSRRCNCYNCLRDGYYDDSDDTYDCLKKLCYYIMNYGSAYASEFYHYFSKSKVLENNFNGHSLSVISLGCGFSPELIALNKYISDKNLKIGLKYLGLDNEALWARLRIDDSRVHYVKCDLLSGFDLSGHDLVFINKLFSTLKNIGKEKQFLRILKQQIDDTLPVNSFLVFNDVNRNSKGRDEFDSYVTSSFREIDRYYFPIDNAYTGTYTAISETENVFEIPRGLKVYPKLDVTKDVIFEYRK